MGYDPIFKQQPGPAQIQPAPNSTPHQPAVPASSPPGSASYSPQVPQGYAPAASTGYAPAASTASSTHSQYDNFNNSAIDPALAAADPAMNGQQAYNGAHALQTGLRGSPYSSVPPEPPVLKGKATSLAGRHLIASSFLTNKQHGQYESRRFSQSVVSTPQKCRLATAPSPRSSTRNSLSCSAKTTAWVSI